MNIFAMIRERIGAVVAALVASIAFCVCGLLFTFVLAPRQALEANRIGNLPQMDASSVADAAPGEEILITGTLVENALVLEDSRLVAYQAEEWQVDPPDPESEDDTPSGEWRSAGQAMPDLVLDMGGSTLQILSAKNVRFSGNLHEEWAYGEGPESAEFEGEQILDGTLRYRGFYNGDRATVLGVRASTVQGVIPEKLFAGDRVAFEQSEADAARGMLVAGIVMVACAPLVLVGGVLGALFGRRRRGFRFR